MFRLSPIYYSIANSRNPEIIKILVRAGADPCITASFTMRGPIVRDTASAMLAALVSERITALETFYEYGFVLKRKWFQNSTRNNAAWLRAIKLSEKVPTLKSLARKTIKLALSQKTRIPSRATVNSLELPKTLQEFLQFK